MTVLFIVAYIAVGIIGVSAAIVCIEPAEIDSDDRASLGFLAFCCAAVWPLVAVVLGVIGLLWLWMTLLNRLRLR